MATLAESSRWKRKPVDHCDVVMKGGITSGVIYPRALVELARHYRFRGMGGSSAGAIGAALGAAAEFGRSRGGFARLYELPDQLDLGSLFRPERSTRALLPILMAFTGFRPDGGQRTGFARALAIIGAIASGFPFAGILGLLPGVGLIIAGALAGSWPGYLLIPSGAVLAIIGWIVAMGIRLGWKLTRSVPANLFGICRGLDPTGGDDGLTNWLSTKLDLIAGLTAEEGPLRFGHLWTGRRNFRAGSIGDIPAFERSIDLRMISTCLSRSRPYEMPLKARTFLYDPAVWATLFPAAVMRALDDASPDDPEAAANTPALRRLPDAADLPVIVATRMSLSFPLLIAAVPLWSVSYRKPSPDDAAERTGAPQYEKLWFSDGGLASNFPVHLFDAPLPGRPTFAINLGSFSERTAPFEDQRDNIVLARDNLSLQPSYQAIPESGIGAVTGFASAIFFTARDWHDNSHLDAPGYRDRIVRVLQTKTEGGLNLTMSPDVIDRLADRGQVAAREIVTQFREKTYPTKSEKKTHTGWDNHRWVRYRALLAGMPAFLGGFVRGHDALDIDFDDVPSYEFDGRAADLARLITDGLRNTAFAIEPVNEQTTANLTDAPGPPTVIRRVPQI